MKDKAYADKFNAQALILLMQAGVKLEEINATLDTSFTELNYDTANKANAAASGGSQADGQQGGSGGN
jgi:hypothetical protein